MTGISIFSIKSGMHTGFDLDLLSSESLAGRTAVLDMSGLTQMEKQNIEEDALMSIFLLYSRRKTSIIHI